MAKEKKSESFVSNEDSNGYVIEMKMVKRDMRPEVINLDTSELNLADKGTLMKAAEVQKEVTLMEAYGTKHYDSIKHPSGADFKKTELFKILADPLRRKRYINNMSNMIELLSKNPGEYVIPPPYEKGKPTKYHDYYVGWTSGKQKGSDHPVRLEHSDLLKTDTDTMAVVTSGTNTKKMGADYSASSTLEFLSRVRCMHKLAHLIDGIAEKKRTQAKSKAVQKESIEDMTSAFIEDSGLEDEKVVMETLFSLQEGGVFKKMLAAGYQPKWTFRIGEDEVLYIHPLTDVLKETMARLSYRFPSLTKEGKFIGTFSVVGWTGEFCEQIVRSFLGSDNYCILKSEAKGSGNHWKARAVYMDLLGNLSIGEVDGDIAFTTGPNKLETARSLALRQSLQGVYPSFVSLKTGKDGAGKAVYNTAEAKMYYSAMLRADVAKITTDKLMGKRLPGGQTPSLRVEWNTSSGKFNVITDQRMIKEMENMEKKKDEDDALMDAYIEARKAEGIPLIESDDGKRKTPMIEEKD